MNMKAEEMDIKLKDFFVVPLESKLELWGRRSILLVAFGLVGVGAVLGAGSVYLVYIKHQLEEHLRLQTTISNLVRDLKKDVAKLKSTYSVSTLSKHKRKSKKKLKLKKDLEENRDSAIISSASEEEEYLTASEDEKVAQSLIGTENDDIFEVDEDTFYLNIDSLVEGSAFQQHDAYEKLRNYKNKLSKSVQFWWRFAKSTYMESISVGEAGEQELKKTLTFSAVSYAEKALELDDSSAEAHKWYAITLGAKGDYLTIKEKIQNGFIFKEHVDKAVFINPNDPSLYYLLGRFCYEVSQLSWIERRVASTLFSTPPTATITEALTHLRKAQSFGKPFLENELYIVKCLIASSDFKEAANCLREVINLPAVSPSDVIAQQEMLLLYNKYKKYL